MYVSLAHQCEVKCKKKKYSFRFFPIKNKIIKSVGTGRSLLRISYTENVLSCLLSAFEPLPSQKKEQTK